MDSYRKQMNIWLEGNRPFSAMEIRAAGIPSQILVELHRRGEIERLARGIYLPAKAMPGENLSLQIASLKVPDGVVCLLSALRFHEFTTQLPHEVWLMLKQRSWIPKDGSQQLRIFTMTDTPFNYGIEKHNLDGITVNVYSPAKTIADCFKFRNKIGLEVALEALREGIRGKRFTIPELTAAAKVCRVLKIITPYIESILE